MFNCVTVSSEKESESVDKVFDFGFELRKSAELKRFINGWAFQVRVVFLFPASVDDIKKNDGTKSTRG
jgi:hypothetical protein